VTLLLPSANSCGMDTSWVEML